MSALQELRATMARLRAPDGCPWDREQDHRTLSRYLIEECAELLDAIDRMDLPHMREELGDVLLQVVFHAQMAEEAGHFDLEQVAAEINEKLIRRHPHVFGEGRLGDSEAVLAQWEKIKAEEKAAAGRSEATRLKPLPPALPALLFANDVFKQLQKRGLLGLAPVDGAAVASAAEGLDASEAGKRLFELAAACRLAGVDPEAALRLHTRKVIDAVESA
jgi:MazG family protein